MDASGNEQDYVDCRATSSDQMPPSNCEVVKTEYLNPMFLHEVMLAQHPDPQEADASTDENVYEDYETRTVSAPQTAGFSGRKTNSNRKTYLLLGGVSAISVLVALVALILASFAFEKQGSLSRSVEELVSREMQVPSSCKALHAAGETRSGLYTIRPTPNETSFSTFCDMTSGGGGWTLVASVHENNIDGKCTVGDKWSSEQGMEYSSLEASGSWENYDVFGDIHSLTSSDYKNPAFYNLKASDVMLWHVPNNVNIGDIEDQAFLKYYTSNGFLSENGFTLRNFFDDYAPLQPVPVPDLRTPLSDNTWFEKLRVPIPDFYSYTYDGSTPDYISNGGGGMYNEGNRVSFSVNNGSYVSVTYGKQYGRRASNHSTDSEAARPFMFLTWIGFGRLDSFKIRVVSNPGANGDGEIKTYTSSFNYSDSFRVGYRGFQVYDAGRPSICEVYFYISSIQKWKSTIPEVDYPRWSTSTNALDNEIQFQGARNIFAGYTLLSGSSGNEIIESQFISVLQAITDRLGAIPFSDIQDHVTPITFEKGSIDDIRARVPTSQKNLVTPGYIEFKAIDEFGYPYALCPGVDIGQSATPSVHCIGGINSNWNGQNPSCGDFSDWNKGSNPFHSSPSDTGRSLEDIQSSILIFTRDGQ